MGISYGAASAEARPARAMGGSVPVLRLAIPAFVCLLLVALGASLSVGPARPAGVVASDPAFAAGGAP